MTSPVTAGLPRLQSADSRRDRPRSRHGLSDERRQRIRALAASLSQEVDSFGNSMAATLKADEEAVSEILLCHPSLGSSAETIPEPIEGAGQCDEEKLILESGVMQAMLHDNAVMKMDVLEYDAALQRSVKEVGRLRVQVKHLDRMSGRSAEIQEMLVQERQAQEELRSENAKLLATNTELLSMLHTALDNDGSVELDAFTDRLALENDMLWKLIKVSQIASRISASTLQVPPLPRRQRPSLGSRSARSSTASSPTKCSPSARNARLGFEEGHFNLEGAAAHPHSPPTGVPGMLLVDEEDVETSPFKGSGAGSLFVHAPKSPCASGSRGELDYTSEQQQSSIDEAHPARASGAGASAPAMVGPDDDEEVDSSGVQEDVDLSSLACLEQHADEQQVPIVDGSGSPIGAPATVAAASGRFDNGCEGYDPSLRLD